MADVALALQKAIAAALAGMAVPSAVTGKSNVTISMVDSAPDNAPWPHVVLERHEVEPQDAFEATESQHTIDLEVWSQYRGSRQVQAILTQMRDRLHNTTPALEAGQCMSLRVTHEFTAREPDAVTYKGAMTLTAITAAESL